MTSDKMKDVEHFIKNIKEDIRPWGKFRSFPHKQAGSIKIITLNPGQALSLQYHHHRSEFWIVLDRGLEVTVGDRVWQPEESEEILIPQKTPHRIRSLSQDQARVMEIWIGDSDESDIVRLQDDYGRE
jgi:mannose-6-phosphate isomerase-like protein (cupin superfamily)